MLVSISIIGRPPQSGAIHEAGTRLSRFDPLERYRQAESSLAAR